jgi:UDP-glucose 6-dehydrogenase
MSAAREPIGVIGTGYVGLVTAAGFAELGSEVWCVDIDAAKIERLRRGEVPIYEPGLEEMLARNAARLHFSTDLAGALEHARLLFVAVGTPPTHSGDADLSAVHAVVDAIPSAKDRALVMKSTVPCGTGASLLRVFGEQGKDDLAYVSCPEFLKEGSAIKDFLAPDRVVVGDTGGWAGDAVVELYSTLDAPLVRTDIASAEMVKLASNAFLATKISFINEIANVCEETGADVVEVARGMGLDDRIGSKFLQAGIGFGGSCFAPGETALARVHGRTTLVTFEQLWERVSHTSARIESDDALRAFGAGSDTAVLEPEGLEVLSWVRDEQEPRFLPVMALSRRAYEGELIDVHTKMGRRVRTTPDHPWVVGDGGGEDSEIKLAFELTCEDWVPLAGRRPAPQPSRALLYPLDSAIEAACLSAEEVLVRPPAETVAELVARPLAERRAIFAHPRGVGARTGDVTPDDVMLDRASWRAVGLDLAAGNASGYAQRLPDLIWDRSDEDKWALLSGLWEGDGSWSLINGGPSVVLELGTVSDELADGVLRLLGDLGIAASRRVGRTKRSTKDTHWLRISGADQVERALELVPVRDREGVCATVARQSKRIAPTGHRRFGDGPAWARISGLRRERFSGHVYSLEVPYSHTVVTSGGVTTSNCFPKDVDALKQLAGNSGYHFQLLTAVIEVNELQKRRVIGKLQKHLGGALAGKRVALLGLAFKPETDDMREASSLVLSARLHADGALVSAYDPVAEEQARALVSGITFADSPLEAVEGVDAAVLVTEWRELVGLDWQAVAGAMAGNVIIDGRNALDAEAIRAAGLIYEGIGRR